MFNNKRTTKSEEGIDPFAVISSSGFFIETEPQSDSGGGPDPLLFCSGTLFVSNIGQTTGTTSSEEYTIKKYLSVSDLISSHFHESIIDFLKTVDNKDN